MAPLFSLIERAVPEAQGALSQTALSPVIIAGIVVACVLGVGVALWLGIRYYRKRSSAERESQMGSGFLSVRGVVKEGEEKDGVSRDVGVFKGTQFSRNQMSDVIMPQKAVLRPDASNDEIIGHYAAEGTLPRPFAPFMGGGIASGEPDKKRASTSSFLSIGHNSFLSLGSSSRRFSVASAATTVSTIGHAGKRKVRQIFTPVLPDELVISVGDRVTIINSFDDGWCIVGRDGFGGEVELGAVPAWCFIKPSPGLRAERPLRTTSLGVTVNIDSGPESRGEVMSWSNF